MRLQFVYKIWSGYDGFSPSKIPERKDKFGRVRLGWSLYLDEVERGAEIWVYFHGRGTPSPGVYLKGRVDAVDFSDQCVWLRPTGFRTEKPLTDKAVSERLATLVRPRGRQVFLFPESWEPLPLDVECDLYEAGISCESRRCRDCAEWLAFPLIDPGDANVPERLRHVQDRFEGFVPAYWIIPSRCYLGRNVRPVFRRLSRLFYDLKTGATSRVHPFALGLVAALERQKLGAAIGLVTSVPLSPDKKAACEVDRTRLLGKEVAELLGVEYRPVLRLTRAISKRRPPWRDLSSAAYEESYRGSLEVTAALGGCERLLVVDDVCTRGSTLAAAVRVVEAASPDTEIVLATGGQMIVRPAVSDDSKLRAGAGA